jgi:hypothetical protein
MLVELGLIFHLYQIWKKKSSIKIRIVIEKYMYVYVKNKPRMSFKPNEVTRTWYEYFIPTDYPIPPFLFIYSADRYQKDS